MIQRRLYDGPRTLLGQSEGYPSVGLGCSQYEATVVPRTFHTPICEVPTMHPHLKSQLHLKCGVQQLSGHAVTLGAPSWLRILDDFQGELVARFNTHRS